MDAKLFSNLILKNCLRFSLKDRKIITLTLVIEYFLIYMESIASIGRILLTLNIIDQEFFLSAFSPYYLFNNMKNSYCLSGFCQFPDILFYIALVTISILVLVLFLIILHEKNNDSYEKENLRELYKNTNRVNLQISSNNSTSDTKTWKSISINLIKYFCINFFDLFTFKILGLFVVTVILDKIIYGINNSGTGNSLVNLILGVMFLFIFLYSYMFQIENVNIMIQFNPEFNYHYDHKFSKKYDYILLFLKIVIALENNLFFSSIFGSLSSNGDKILFFDVIFLVSILAFTLSIVYQLITNESIFLINNMLNTCRLFFLFFNSFTIMIIFIFISSIEKSIFLLIVIVSMFIFSTIAIFLLLRVKPNLIFRRDKYIAQLIKIIHKYFTLSNEHFNNHIIEIHAIHVNYCVKGYSNITNEECLICNNINLDHFIKNFIYQIKLLIKNKILTLSREERCYFKFAKLISAERGWLGDTEEKSLIYKTKLLFYRKKFSDKHFLSNLNLFFDYINVYESTKETKFNLIKKYYETNQLIYSSIEKLQEVFLLFDINSKKDFYPLAMILHQNKKLIMKNIQFFMSNKNVFSDLYSIMIIRYNFEKLYNHQLEDNDMLYNFENQEDTLNEFFFNDKLLNMIYNLKNNQITIFNASKQYVIYKNKNLEEIFPKNFRKYGVDYFLTCLKKNDEGFNYEYIVQTENYFISNIRLTSSLLKSHNLDELMIISKIESTSEDIIIFQTFGDKMNQDFLVEFSESIGKLLFIHPRWIGTIKKFSKYVLMSMNNIFERDNRCEVTTQEENYTKTEYYDRNSYIDSKRKSTTGYSHEFYILNYSTYYSKVYSKLIKYIEDQLENDPIAEIYQAEIEKLAKQNYQIKATISFMYRIYNNEDITCNVYSFKLLKQTADPKINIEENQSMNVCQLYNNYKDSEKVLKNETSEQTARSKTSYEKESFSNTYTKIEVKKKESELNKYSLATVFMNYFIISFCMIFVIIGMADNKFLIDLNNLQISFKNFQNNLVFTAINAYISVGVFYPNSNDYSNYLTGSYFDKFKGNPDVQVDLLQYINKELTAKVEILKEYLLQFQYDIHNSIYAPELEGIMLTRVEYYSISRLGNNLVLDSKNVTFTDMINILMTNGMTAVYTFDYNLIYIFSLDINTKIADFSGIYDKNITSAQKMIYELAMNYPNYLKYFKMLEGFINGVLESNHDEIFNKNLILTFVLIGLHFLLILISLIIMDHLKKIIYEHNKYINKTITPELSKYMQTKIFILKDLNAYYSEAPSNLVNKFKNLKKEFIQKLNLTKKTNKNVKEISSNTTTKKINREIKYREKIRIANLLKPISILIFVVFSIYYAYAFIFLGGIYLSYNNLNTTFDYFNLMQGVNIYSLNNYILHQTLQFSNQTDIGFSNYLIDQNYPYNFGVKGKNFNYVNNVGYIHQTIDIIKQMSVELMKIEKESSTFSEVKSQIDTAIDCNTLYYNNDEVISQFVSFYGGNKLVTSLQAFCKSFDFIKNSDWTEIIFETDYYMVKLLADFNFANGDYMKIKNVNDQNIYFEMLAILSLIFRPAQAYFFDSIMIPMINNSTNSYLMIIILYLISKMIVVILIFFIIKKKLNDRVNEINDDIKCMLECISN